jgi:hypothetical protein
MESRATIQHDRGSKGPREQESSERVARRGRAGKAPVKNVFVSSMFVHAYIFIILIDCDI